MIAIVEDERALSPDPGSDGAQAEDGEQGERQDQTAYRPTLVGSKRWTTDVGSRLAGMLVA